MYLWTVFYKAMVFINYDIAHSYVFIDMTKDLVLSTQELVPL